MKTSCLKMVLLSLFASVSMDTDASFFDELQLSGVKNAAFNALITENQNLQDGYDAVIKEFDILYAKGTLGALSENIGESMKSAGSTAVELMKSTGSTAVESMKFVGSTAVEVMKSTGSTAVESMKSAGSTAVESIKSVNFPVIVESMKSVGSTVIRNNVVQRVGFFGFLLIGVCGGFVLGIKMLTKYEHRINGGLKGPLLFICGIGGEVLGILAWKKFLEAAGAK